MSDQIPVPFPPVAKGRKAHLLSSEYLNDLRGSIQRLASRPRAPRSPYCGDTIPPFTCSLRYDATAAKWYITASPGYVCERDVVQGDGADALFYWEPKNMWDGDYPREHEIAVDQAVFVFVPEAASGAVTGADVEIKVDGDTTESTNFIPGTQAGEYYYKLAALKTVDGVIQLVPFMAGSHIYHVSGLTADFRILGCTDIYNENPQLARLSFLSGKLVAVGESVEDRPLAATVEEVILTPCT